MVDEPELRKALQFLLAQPSWVMKDIAHQENSEVISVKAIPKEDGIYWVAGQTTLRSGRKLDSVFRVDTNAGGSLVSVFWKINGQWHRHDADDTLTALGMVKDEVFPFDWSTAVPLQEDIFHS